MKVDEGFMGQGWVCKHWRIQGYRWYWNCRHGRQPYLRSIYMLGQKACDESPLICDEADGQKFSFFLLFRYNGVERQDRGLRGRRKGCWSRNGNVERLRGLRVYRGDGMLSLRPKEEVDSTPSSTFVTPEDVSDRRGVSRTLSVEVTGDEPEVEDSPT